MKKFFSLFLLSIMLLCTACSDDKNIQTQPETTTITIPESYLKFTRADVEEEVESYKEYCTDAKAEGPNLVLEITEEQRKKLIAMNDEYIEKTIKEFETVNSDYKCELSPDYSRVVYEYDENLYEYDLPTKGRIQAGILLGVTSTHALNGILENNNPDWEIQLVVKNCHTGRVVVEVNLPEEECFLGEEEWEASYSE